MTGPVGRPPPDWDARYAKAEAGGLYGAAPNEYLRMITARSDFEIGSALMLADGDGRNGTWLAARGIEVTAIDLSRLATERALARDRQAGITVERIVTDLSEWSPAPGRQWDAVFLFYLHGPAALWAGALGGSAAAIAPGGWAVVEGFGKAQASRPEMGPGDPALLYSVEELAAALAGFEVIEAFTGRLLLAEGGAHRGEAEVVRFAVRRMA